MKLQWLPAMGLMMMLACGDARKANNEPIFDAVGPIERLPVTAMAPIRVAFWNVENLFDTIDGPNDDAEFLPGSKNAWGAERYERKLAHLAQVIDSIQPQIIGFAEVENEGVLRDLQSNCAALRGMKIAHIESPDARGIDCALMYDSTLFALSNLYDWSIHLPSGYATRGVLDASLTISATQQSIHVYVNHWPSRRNGMEESQPNRIIASERLNRAIEENIDAKWVALGDFNDNPNNESMLSLPGVNLAAQLRSQDSTVGTLRWWTGWDFFDQIITNAEPADAQQPMSIVKYDFMLQQEGKYQGWPNRTFGGSTYLGGYSDHMPVYTDLLFSTQGL
jgi:endonuclease/exonuclease/phosphatase family metal-dependent hydrolase